MIKLSDSGAGIYGILKDGDRIGTAYLSKRYRPAPHIPVGFVVRIRLKSGKVIMDIARTIPEAKRCITERERW